MNLLLDTCALLWLAQGSRKLGRRTRKAIEDAAVVYVSAISGWEVALKVGQRKLSLPKASGDWFTEVCDQHNLQLMPIDLAVAIHAAEMPRHHRDPCDRLIIATAALNELKIVTADPSFKQYGVEIVWG